MKSGVEYDLSRLQNFVDELNAKSYLKIGILGAKDKRKSKEGVTNAQIGLVHEFGRLTSKPIISSRSFLRMPLMMKSEKIIGNVMKVGEQNLVEGGKEKALKIIGVACVEIISEAFETRGFGTWQALKDSTVRQKIQKNTQPLVNTRQLQKAVSYQVVKK